ncbi:helix-turn-helix transcriptional regulator [Mycolicibacterium sp. PAM1]|uniref:Putative transcriptional regulator, XRE family n=1 Tax=Mycolicibacterium gilvum (strain PYR-GCK) TaxID=350054 RepID=A4T1H6_MYCGI|nr:helix-turn-helix transcriptional regulator [Mycolicibacterium sp. PAM1]ABP47636.1 putative transcriptional regulator, XRE family [Mycolicibacterium gilvum PYR-GCK]MBV5246052.1 helix-turn-helix transcriptional regulator [Mycolicibacterium sp. PAM1]
MDTRAQRRLALGEFLRARREAIRRADVGLPELPRARTGGLRREEVAVTAGVSVTWYTWLEQGRDINPSKQVLDAVADALRLSPAEHEYVLALGGYAVDAAVSRGPLPPHIQHFLDALEGYPAFAITPDWGIAAWNTTYAALYPNVERVPETDRNLLWLVFTDPYIHELLPNWDTDSRRFLAEFRADAGPRVGEPSYTALVSRLSSESPHFAAAWQATSIERFTSRERLFRHPAAGELRLEHHQVAPVDVPDIQIVAYLPVPDSVASERLRMLTGQADTAR